MVEITYAICLAVWVKIIVLAKTQCSLSHLAAIIAYKENLCCPSPTSQHTS